MTLSTTLEEHPARDGVTQKQPVPFPLVLTVNRPVKFRRIVDGDQVSTQLESLQANDDYKAEWREVKTLEGQMEQWLVVLLNQRIEAGVGREPLNRFIANESLELDETGVLAT